MNDFDRLNKLMGFNPTSLGQDEGDVTPSDIKNIMLKGGQNLPVLEDTISTPEAIITEPEPREPYVPEYGKIPMSDPRRYSLIDEQHPETQDHGRKTYTLLEYNNDPNLEGIISTPPPPQKKTMEFTQPMTISGGRSPAKRSSIPTAQPTYGMYTPPVITAVPKVNKLKARQNAQAWIKDNLDYLPEDASLGLILKEMPKEHRAAIKKTVDKAIKEGMNKQTIANWLLGRKRK